MPKKILIIGFVWPEQRSSAAGVRMMQLVHFFLEGNYEVIFSSTATKNGFSENLTELGVEEVPIKLNDSSFDELVAELSPTIVLFDRFMTEEQFGWRVKEHSPDSLLLLDTEDLHFLRKAREYQKTQSQTPSLNLINDFTKREIASIYRCDLSLIISEFEMELLQNKFKIDTSLLFYLPYLFETMTYEEVSCLPKFDDRKDFITIGNFRHPPNLDAVVFLKNEIWPIIRRQIETAKVHIYGSYCNKKVLSLSDKKNGFIIEGFSDSVETVMQAAKVSLAPIRFGAGLKGKVVDSFRNGTPCVMSSIAAEGIIPDFNSHYYVADSPAIFAIKAIELYQTKEEWIRNQKIGFEILSNKFDKTFHQKQFLERIEDLNKKLDAHRESNFIGSMLHHHTLQSTKYMSKWIEEKNK